MSTPSLRDRPTGDIVKEEQSHRTKRLTKVLASGTPMLLALAIVALIAIPVAAWRHPAIDVTYEGFDPNLMFISTTGPAVNAGTIDVNPKILTITALPGSHPTVHLLTTPLTFSASFDVTVIAESAGTIPLRAGIWSPTTRAGYFLVFDRDAGNIIRSETVVNGTGLTDLVGGDIKSQQVLGHFATGQSYHVTIGLDKVSRTIAAHIVSQSSPPAGLHALRVDGATGGITEVDSSPVAVTPGASYSFGGWVSKVAAASTYSIGVLWYDSGGKRLPSNTDQWWRPPPGDNGWGKTSAATVAPSRAASARIFLGAGPASTYMFDGIFLEDGRRPGSNLILNGSFEAGSSEWATVIGGTDATAVLDLSFFEAASRVTALEAQELFEAFRPSLTVSVFSETGIAEATVRNFVVALPSQPSSAAEQTEKVNDPRAQMLVQLLWTAAIVLGLVSATVWVRSRTPRRTQHGSAKATNSVTSRVASLKVMLRTSAFGLYIAANMLLFRFGSPQFDVLGAKVWSYVAFKYGIVDLYYRPLLVPMAALWQGAPVHEAVFPYGVTSAYYFLIVGWVNQLWLSPAGPSLNDNYSLEVLLKFINVVFALLDGLLIYAIVRRLAGPRSAWQSALIFGLNPAIVFVMSVWGSTETFSLFFVLASIWFAEGQKPLGAWLMLAAGAFTRPQMLVLAFFLGLVYLRKFGVVRNLRHVSWTVVICFILLGPFALAISPSVPIDYVSRTLGFVVGGGQADPNYLGLSPANYSVWTLVLQFVSGQHGLARMWSPSTDLLSGSWTYGQIASRMSVAFVLVIGLALLVSKTLSVRAGQYLPLVAFGMLGWLLLTPGVISRYFVYAIVLVILCRGVFGSAVYFLIVGAVTAITFITSYGHLAVDFLGNGATSNVLNPTNNEVSRIVYELFANDRVITLGAVVNLMVLLVLAVKVAQSSRRGPYPSTAAPSRAI